MDSETRNDCVRKLDREKVHFTVAKEVEKFIRDNGLKCGDVLPSEKKIAEQLGIGRSSVREGICLLEGMDIIEVRPGKGIYVKNTTESAVELRVPITREALLEVLDVREMLEVQACELMICNATDREKAGIAQAYEKLAAKIHLSEPTGTEDMEFHMEIYNATHNGYLRTLLESIILLFFPVWEEPYGIHPAMLASFPLHEDLYRALMDGNGKAAAASIHGIIEHNRTSVMEHSFDETPAPAAGAFRQR